jgi:hypothetical protein
MSNPSYLPLLKHALTGSDHTGQRQHRPGKIQIGKKKAPVRKTGALFFALIAAYQLSVP